MADFSKEYYQLNNLNSEYFDFSYEQEFKTLKRDDARMLICEGLGFYGIVDIAGEKFIIKDIKRNLISWIEFKNQLRLKEKQP